MVKKFFIVIISFVTILLLISSISYSEYTEEVSKELGLGNLSEYEGKIKDSQLSGFLSKVGVVLGVIQAIGIIVSVAMIGIVGIKYMLGSVEEKAEYKKTVISYAIGAVLVFSITTVPEIIYKLVHGY